VSRPRRPVVVVDGPSGSGKSSAARGVAARLGLRYLDTGAMYRAVTWWLIHHGVDVDDPQAVTMAVPDVAVEVTTDPEAAQVRVNGRDVTGGIRERAVSNAVSAVSAVPAVRERMVAVQRRVLAGGGVVAEGRDLGTVVAPDADLKVFLTADSEARAQRRQAELSAEVSVADTEQELLTRDHRDSTRELSPLTMADDAVLLDSTGLTLAQVIDRVTSLVVSLETTQRHGSHVGHSASAAGGGNDGAASGRTGMSVPEDGAGSRGAAAEGTA
jgi:cytidylate kinase